MERSKCNIAIIRFLGNRREKAAKSTLGFPVFIKGSAGLLEASIVSQSRGIEG